MNAVSSAFARPIETAQSHGPQNEVATRYARSPPQEWFDLTAYIRRSLPKPSPHHSRHLYRRGCRRTFHFTPSHRPLLRWGYSPPRGHSCRAGEKNAEFVRAVASLAQRGTFHRATAGCEASSMQHTRLRPSGSACHRRQGHYPSRAQGPRRRVTRLSLFRQFEAGHSSPSMDHFSHGSSMRLPPGEGPVIPRPHPATPTEQWCRTT